MREEDVGPQHAEVVRRVMERHGGTPAATERALLDTVFEEQRRLAGERARRRTRVHAGFYDRIRSEAARATPERMAGLLREVVTAFVEEVAGHFDPRVYALATRVVPPALNLMLHAMSPMRLFQQLRDGLGRLDDRLVIGGEVEALRAAVARGTVVLVPTNASNLDSILVGYALHRLGLPPFVYGAGLNLFRNPLIGFFLQHLGAYSVDRTRTAPLYKEVLKTYAGCTLERGRHNLFFPGGTRSRSGAVESRLKLGLLGTGLDAYIRNLAAGAQRPDIFIVPCTINYQLVLEAETLIHDHLEATGRSRTIIEDDEFARPRRILDFADGLMSLDSPIHLVLSRPLDPFGNGVDDEGRSVDDGGRPIDRQELTRVDGRPALDAGRHVLFTRRLGEAVVAAFRRDTVIRTLNVLCWTVVDGIEARSPGMDVVRWLRTGGNQESLPLRDVYVRLEGVLGRLREVSAAGRVRLEDRLHSRDLVRVLNDGLLHAGSYHRRPVVVRKGDRLFPVDRKLVLYYRNRLDGFLEGAA